MAVENALGFLRAAGASVEAPVYVIAGPQPFLREYVLDNLRQRMAAAGFQYRAFQTGGAEGFGAVIRELEATDLFAPRRFVACRVLKTYRERGGGGDEDGGDDGAPGGGGGEAGLIEAIGKIGPSMRLGMVYERDSAPPKIRRTVEGAGVVINCIRPFDNQIAQYAEVFARGLKLKLARDTADLLALRHGGDLAAMANALNLAAIAAGSGKIDEADLGGGGGASRVPDLFELAESVARGTLNEALALFDRAVQTGRDPIELLAVEIIPLVRRTLTAAVLLEKRQGAAAIGRVLGLPPSSGLMMRALDGARRFGSARLAAAHQKATLLDASFKAGLLKEREAAIAGLLLELMGPAK
jgi:DNA polymerase III delta subunit